MDRLRQQFQQRHCISLKLKADDSLSKKLMRSQEQCIYRFVQDLRDSKINAILLMKQMMEAILTEYTWLCYVPFGNLDIYRTLMLQMHTHPNVRSLNGTNL